MSATDSNILEQLKHSPRLPEHVDGLLAFLKEEQEKRQDFYEWLTDDIKAEFIEGEVIVHSPVVIEHKIATKNLSYLLDTCVEKFELGFVGLEKILFKAVRNDYEPDICFFNKTKAKDFIKGFMFFPVPDFAIEILSKSTEKRDRGVKFIDYAESGMQEYWIINADNETVEQYENVGGKFELKLKVNDGAIQSIVVPQFEIPVRAIFDSKLKQETLKKFL